MDWLDDCWGYGSFLPLWASCGLQNWAAALLPSLVTGGEALYMGHRKYRVIQKLGEGGYAVVLLVAEVATPHRPHPDPELRALKKVLVHSGEHLEAVQQEMMIHSAVQHHPNMLPLLDYCCSEGPTTGPSGPPLLSPHPSGVSPVAAAAIGGGSSPFATAGASASAATASSPAAAAGGVSNGIGSSSNGDGGGMAAAPLHRSLDVAFGDRGGAATAGGAARGGGGGGVLGLAAEASSMPCGRVACFLFPVFREGTLGAELDRLAAREEWLPSSEVLSMLLQVARAARHIHAHGYAHRDIKPLNVLIATNPDHPSQLKSKQRQQQEQQAAGGRGGGGGSGSSLTRPLNPDVEAAMPQSLSRAGSGLFAFGARYRCVLMDLGSARPRGVAVAGRNQALQLQEEAEAHCSAPYRAPELFDVPSPGQLDYAACDVWALGATLFHIMYGEPPFARAMNASGGSLALAVLNCAIGWPRPPSAAYPPELHSLVRAAMAPEPADRPSADQLVGMAEALLRRRPPLPDSEQP